MKNFLFHINLVFAVWKTLRKYPSAKVSIDIHQNRLCGDGTDG